MLLDELYARMTPEEKEQLDHLIHQAALAPMSIRASAAAEKFRRQMTEKYHEPKPQN